MLGAQRGRLGLFAILSAFAASTGGIHAEQPGFAERRSTMVETVAARAAATASMQVST